jgi:hypothetical protein
MGMPLNTYRTIAVASEISSSLQTYLYIDILGVFIPLNISSGCPPNWRAHPGCPDHLRFVVEKAVNAMPAAFVIEPASGEVFKSLTDCETRLAGFAFAHGFDVVTTHSSLKPPHVSATFQCIHHGAKTRNWRHLSDVVERDSEGIIVSDRQRGIT